MTAYPSSRQKEIIRQNSDASRFMYNRLVALGNERWRRTRALKLLLQISRHIGWSVISNQESYVKRQLQVIAWLSEQIYNPTRIKEQYKWLDKNRNLDAFVFVRARANYQRAWNRFVKVPEARVPNFHKKSMCQSYQTSRITNRGKTDTVRIIDHNHVRLPKLETIRVQPLPEWLLDREDIKISTVSVKRDAAGRYTVGFQLSAPLPFKAALPKTGTAIGIDLNISNFLVDSNGYTIANPKYFDASAQQISLARRKLHRRAHRAKKEGRALSTAKNYQRQRQYLAFLERRVANQRKNFLHNVSKTLIKSHDLVVAEELRSKLMMKNHAFALRLADNGWRLFLTFLEYKAQLYGKCFRTVSPYHTSQTCSNCQFVMGTLGTSKLTLTDRMWSCPQCGIFHVRDQNAAKNILIRGSD